VEAVKRRTVLVAAVAALAIAAGLFVELGRSGDSSPAAPTAIPERLPGALTGPAPWPRNGARLGQRLAVLGLPALGFEGTALHIHAHLDVFVDGKRVVVPAGVGIDPADRFISPLHTHDTSGVIHVESPTVRPFSLGEFFGVWGVPLAAGRLGGYTAGPGRPLRTFVDGHPLSGDPAQLVLKPHQEIVLAYGRLPRPVPASYQFASGL
jgi:hypothetical protein